MVGDVKLLIGAIGLGFVGSALKKSFELKGQKVIGYDKFKEIGSPNDILKTNIVFLNLPTLFVDTHGYDLDAIIENLRFLSDNKYKGLVVIKSTVEPGITQFLADRFNLKMFHNPEFLTERTAFDDFHNQSHIVIGRTKQVQDYDNSLLCKFYKKLYPDAAISECSSDESEAMKIFCNNFYAIKVGIANEFNLFCQKMMIDYDKIKKMMIMNGWIADMHLNVPGPDGKRGWGGNCFLKDTKALEKKMKDAGSSCEILSAAISENKKIRGE